MNRKPIQAVVTIVFLFSAVVVFATDWPQWRGPDRNGITTDPAWTPAALKSVAKVAWEKDVGEGHSACAIQGSKLFTAGNRGDKDEIQCLNALDGSEIWTYAYPCAPGNYPGPRATPVLDGKKLYTFSRDAKVFCLNAADGKLIWERDLAAEEEATNPIWGHASSPVIEGGLVILNACAHGIALDKNTGKTVWSSGKGDASYASAVPYMAKGKKCVAIFSGKEMNGIELMTGRKLWSHAWETSYKVHAADPIISDGYLYLSSGYKTGAGLLDIKGSTPKQVWGVQGEMKNHFNSSVLIDGKIYGIAGNTGRGQLTCMDFKTGAVLWTSGKGYEGLISADGKLIIMDKEGVLTIADVNPATYVEVAKAQVLDGSAKNWTVPVLANGFIYCRNSKGRLVCVDVRK